MPYYVVKFVLSSVGLAAFCWCADYAIFTREAKWKRLLHGGVLRAVADNAVHGVVGGWCWANAVLLMREQFGCVRILQVAACVATASAVDLDHFIEARSLSFQVNYYLLVSRRDSRHLLEHVNHTILGLVWRNCFQCLIWNWS